jgi:hypothetical protein
MAIGLATATRTARAQKILDAMNVGASVASLKLYTTPRPATGGAVGAATLLATLGFDKDGGASVGAALNGVITFNTMSADTSADANGTAIWARILDGDGAFVMDLSVGAAGSGADLIMNNVEVVANGEVSITGNPTITEGNV